MILYHTSPSKVTVPDTAHSRDNLDFGRGFYLTSIREQAVRYASRFRERYCEVWLNIYEMSEDWDEWDVKTFSKYSEDWLDFVAECRSGRDDSEYDMVIGGVANDKVFETVDLYFAGLIGKKEALRRLAFEQPNIQYCIRSEKMLRECLTYKNSIRL